MKTTSSEKKHTFNSLLLGKGKIERTRTKLNLSKPKKYRAINRNWIYIAINQHVVPKQPRNPMLSPDQNTSTGRNKCKTNLKQTEARIEMPIAYRFTQSCRKHKKKRSSLTQQDTSPRTHQNKKKTVPFRPQNPVPVSDGTNICIGRTWTKFEKIRRVGTAPVSCDCGPSLPVALPDSPLRCACSFLDGSRQNSAHTLSSR